MTWTDISIHGTDHLIFLNQERYFGIKNQGMIPERYCYYYYYYYYYFGKKRHNVQTEHIVNKLQENRLKKDKLKEINGWKLYNHTSRRIKNQGVIQKGKLDRPELRV